MPNTLWMGGDNDTYFLNSGFSSTVLDSRDVSSVETFAVGVTSNGPDIIWLGYGTGTIRRQQGFHGPETESVDINSLDTVPTGVTWPGDGTLIFVGETSDVIYKLDGFSTTVLDSFGGIDGLATDVSWDGTDTYYTGLVADVLVQQVGFSSTNKAFLLVTTTDNIPQGISRDDNFDTIWGGSQNDNVYKQVGFTTTSGGSFSVSGSDGNPVSVEHADEFERHQITIFRDAKPRVLASLQRLPINPGKLVRYG